MVESPFCKTISPGNKFKGKVKSSPAIHKTRIINTNKGEKRFFIDEFSANLVYLHGMKIAYLCSSLSFGGLELNHIKNAQFMKERGHEVLIVGINNSPYIEKAQGLGLEIFEINRHRKYYDFKNALKLKKILSDLQIEYLFIRDTRDMSLLASIKFFLRNRIKTAYFMEMQLGVPKKNIFHSLRFSFLDFWFCPLPYMLKQVKEMTRLNQKKVFLLPSAIDLSKVKILPKPEARSKLVMDQSSFYFGLIGRFDIQKGQLLALKAMAACSNKDFNLILLGEPTKNEKNSVYKQMKSMITDLHLSDRVQIHDFIYDVSIFYSAIDCLIMATKAESFGMVTLESIAHFVPVIGSDKGGTPDLLSNGKFGFLFKSMDETDLSQKMDEMSKNPLMISENELKSHLKAFDHNEICSYIERSVLLPPTV